VLKDSPPEVFILKAIFSCPVLWPIFEEVSSLRHSLSPALVVSVFFVSEITPASAWE